MDNTNPVIAAYLEALPEYMRQHHQRLHDAKRRAVVALRAIYCYLRNKYPDLRVIEITYNGSGDSGQIENIRFNPRWRFEVQAELEVIDETMPDELTFGYKPQAGHRWDKESGQWVADSPDRAPTLMELLDAFGWDLADGQNPGFEINEGGFGTILISGSGDSFSDVDIKMSHSERVETTNDYEYSY